MKTPAQQTDQQIVKSLRKGDTSVFEKLYKDKYYLIESLVVKKGGDKHDAKDIFHESLIVLYKNIRKEEFELTSSLSTYIFSIARNLWLKEITKRSKRNEVSISDGKSEFSDTNPILVESASLKEERFKVMKEVLNDIGDPCKSLITKFYFLKKSMEEISSEMGYKSASVAKHQKYKCMERIRKKVKKAMDKQQVAQSY